ncbi:unnamed protein product [Clonostachys byssicola]|uniref:Uncharacterized protein n=1 Tax=Clonostachys byssicola TaxID=160290 RepID=A0A9N9UTV1_9HYPO|nr:unnamed protein product [Clonostachys byssicola]
MTGPYLLRLPIEVYVSESNIYDGGTAYTPTTAPLLYVHPRITEDLQHRLYGNHALVIPIQEPRKYIKGDQQLDLPVSKLSQRRRGSATSIIFEISQTEQVYLYTPDGKQDIDHDFWDDDRKGNALAKLLTGEALRLKSDLPNVGMVSFVFWYGEMSVYVNDWKRELAGLQDQWEDLYITVELNLFEYEDPEAGDGGYNFIQGWDRHFKAQVTRGAFMANNLTLLTHEDGHYEGRLFDPTGRDANENGRYGWGSDEDLYVCDVTKRPRYVVI